MQAIVIDLGLLVGVRYPTSYLMMLIKLLTNDRSRGSTFFSKLIFFSWTFLTVSREYVFVYKPLLRKVYGSISTLLEQKN
jgi:hypothetical protein